MATTKPSKTDEAKLFGQIEEYLSLGTRIGNGLLNIFGTLVTNVSEGKAAALSQFSYSVDNDPAAIYFIFSLTSTSPGKLKPAKVEVVIKDGHRYMTLRKKSVIEPARYPLSIQGVRDLLKKAKL